MNRYSFDVIYKFGKFNGYGKHIAFKRFRILNEYKFDSVLDVGSGPCFLHEWLQENNIKAKYEAVDIRKDSLEYCNCQTYLEIPKNNMYDLVCLFGTVTYNIDQNEQKNRLLLKTLLKDSKDICRSILLFTVFKKSFEEKNKNTPNHDFFVCYDKEEIKLLLNELNIFNFEIIENDEYDNNEYFVVCDVLNANKT